MTSPLIRFVVATLLLACAASAQQPSGTAVLAGRVILRGSGEPVRKAAVTLTWRVSPLYIALARTDAAGRFAFQGLPAGAYSLTATRDGVGSGSFGDEGQPGSHGQFIELAEGEQRTSLTIRISLAASISGTVYDTDGDPAYNAGVQVLTEAYPRGFRQIVPTTWATANARGEYKVTGLAPGKYYVCLQNPGQFQPHDPSGDTQAFRRQYYGGATDWKRATPIIVASGQQVRGIDFRALATSAVKLAGRVTGAPSWQPPGPDSTAPPSPAPFVQISLLPAGEEIGAAGYHGGAGPPEYRFEIGGVAPGAYQLIASLRGSGGRPLYARQTIEVSDPAPELELALTPGVDITGTVRYEGDPALRPAAFDVQLVPGEPIPVESPKAAKTSPEGAFTIAAVPPGIWDINPGPIPKGGFLKSMRLGDQDVLTEDMEITPSTAAPLHIVISSRGGRVEGELQGQNARRKPSTIMLAPVGKFAAVMSFFALAESDAAGRFQLTGLTPGAYRLFAFERQPPGDFRGPELVKKLEPLGVPVDVKEGETIPVNVTPLTPAQVQEALR